MVVLEASGDAGLGVSCSLGALRLSATRWLATAGLRQALLLVTGRLVVARLQDEDMVSIEGRKWRVLQTLSPRAIKT